MKEFFYCKILYILSALGTRTGKVEVNGKGMPREPGV